MCMKIVIRAGGGGTRLWPVSRKEDPKQFHALIGDQSLLETTYARIEPLLSGPNDVYVSVSDRFVERVSSVLPHVLHAQIIAETDKKNTGPAMALEVAVLLRDGVSEDEVIASIPSDDYIQDAAAFRSLLQRSAAYLSTDPEAIITPGFTQDTVDTGYSYIQAGDRLSGEGDESVFEVLDWVEKPDYERCKELLEAGGWYAHAGMYIWTLGTIRGLFQQLQPQLFAVCQEVAALMHAGDEASVQKARSLYARVEEQSIEAAITSQAPRIVMATSATAGWSDLGKWHILQRLLAASDDQGNVVQHADVASVRAQGNLVVAPEGRDKDKVVVLMGVSDLVVVDTDDAVLIAHKEVVGDVKDALEQLKERGRTDVL